jgi:hypothetical protein
MARRDPRRGGRRRRNAKRAAMQRIQGRRATPAQRPQEERLTQRRHSATNDAQEARRVARSLGLKQRQARNAVKRAGRAAKPKLAQAVRRASRSEGLAHRQAANARKRAGRGQTQDRGVDLGTVRSAPTQRPPRDMTQGGPASDFQPGGRFGRPQLSSREGGDAVASGPGLQDLLKRQGQGGQAHTPESRARFDQDLAAFKGRQSQQPPRPPQRATPPGRVMDVMSRVDDSGSPNDLRVREMLRQRMSQPPPSQEDRLARQQGQQIGRTAVMPPPVRTPGQTIQMGYPVQPPPGGLGQAPPPPQRPGVDPRMAQWMQLQQMKQQFGGNMPPEFQKQIEQMEQQFQNRMNPQPATPPRPPLGTNQLVGNALAKPPPQMGQATGQREAARNANEQRLIQMMVGQGRSPEEARRIVESERGMTRELAEQGPRSPDQGQRVGLIDQPRQPIAERRLETQGQPRNEMVNDTSRRAQDEQRRKLLEEQKRKRMSGGLPFQRVGNFRPPQASNRAGPGNASYRMR